MDNTEAIRRIKDHIRVHKIGQYPHIKIAEALSLAISALAADNNVGSKWIPVTERLPDKDGTYLIRTKSGAVCTAKFYTEKTFPPTRYRPTEYKRTAQWSGNRKVTEWMPLPK